MLMVDGKLFDALLNTDGCFVNKFQVVKIKSLSIYGNNRQYKVAIYFFIEFLV